LRKTINLTACLLALVFAFAGSFAGPARAQTGAEPELVSVPAESFVLFENERGETVCRVATPEEHERLRAAAATHVIYHGAPRRRQVLDSGDEILLPNAVEDSSGVPLLPSAGLTIVLQGTAQLEANPAAKNAFIAAANSWEAVISSPVTITLSVDYGPQLFGEDYPSTSILGATSSSGITSSLATVRSRLINNSNPTASELQLYNALPTDSVPAEFNGMTVNVSNIRVNAALGRALGFNISTTNPDARIGFNSNFGNGGQFDFDPSNGITAGFTDFDAVVLHEIGHALGFTSSNGSGESSELSVWDLFRFRPGAANAGNFGSAPRVLSQGDAQVMFGNFTNTYATQELALSTGGPLGVSDGGGDGRQSSHWKDDQLATGSAFIGIMDPTARRSVHRSITENDTLAIDLLGYSVVFNPQRPANDNFINATGLGGVSGGITTTNFWATREPGELSTQPNGAQAGFVSDKSVWFTWTAPTTGTATFTTANSSFDTTLGIYVGNSVSTVVPACPFASACQNDDAGNGVTSTVQFNTTAGTTYYIDVDGWNSEHGTVVLNWTSTGTTPTPTPTPTPPASFQFHAAATTAIEHNGAAGFVITRTGDLTSTTSVNYSVTSGTATAGADFVQTTGTINFLGGDLSKVVTVKINDDTTPESSETVVVTLTSGAGSSIVGTPNSAVLTILDDDNFPANSVRISGAATQTIAEGGGNIDLTVTRSGDTSQAASVDYRTTDGTALNTRDYIFAGGTLDFAAGETTKTFSVLVNEDVYVEGEERLTVALSNPARTTLDAAQSAVQVAVQDNDSANGATNPNDVSQAFVRQHYHDFLNREPDAAGLAFWTGDIEQCGADAQCRQVKRINVSAAFFLSIEFQETGYLVYRAYKTAYGTSRGAVPIRYDEMLVESQRISRGVQVGIGNWREQLEANKTAFFNELVDSGHFRAEYPAEMTPAQFVDKMFRNTALYGQRDAFIAQLTADPSQAGRVALVRQVAESEAVKTGSKNGAFVLMEYFGYMRRNPDDAPDGNLLGYNHWLGKLQQFGGNYVNAEMVKAFLESIEYRTRFAP
jgi:hypothetical protein